jgi:hypothetical protein
VKVHRYDLVWAVSLDLQFGVANPFKINVLIQSGKPTIALKSKVRKSTVEFRAFGIGTRSPVDSSIVLVLILSNLVGISLFNRPTLFDMCVWSRANSIDMSRPD